MFVIEEELKKLPKKPGVYLMKDKDDKIIYVGKAINLKNRVSSYFRKTDKTNRILKMVSLIDHFEYIVVDNEAEALILECNLIKKNRPKFNVLLKDDKTYPYIKVDIKSEYPNVAITRRIVNDGSKYFGPYANPGAAKEMLDFIKQKYKIRQCRNFKYNDRPCLNYHIKRCLAPCQGYVSREEYMEQINEIIDLLEGKTDKILKDLKNQMKIASEKQEYEKAAYIRDRMVAIDRASSMQKVSNISENNIDVIGLAKSEFQICIEVFFVRGSKMIGREHYFFTDLNDMEESEVIAGFIKQFYMDNLNIPNKIMIKEVLENEEVLEKWLSTIAGHKVEIHSTKRGQKLKFVEMAENNEASESTEDIEPDKETENTDKTVSASDDSQINEISDELSKKDIFLLALKDVQVSEETKEFVAKVDHIEFSNPELLWVDKVEKECTVSELKKENGLEVQYSGELTEEQIDEINAQTVETGDWALISLQQFYTEETLTVTMTNGKTWTIRVTDAVAETPVRNPGTVSTVDTYAEGVKMWLFNYDTDGNLDDSSNKIKFNGNDHTGKVGFNDDTLANDGINSYSGLKFLGWGSDSDYNITSNVYPKA